MLSDEEKKAINDLNFIIVTDIYDIEISINKTKIINEYNKSVGIALNLIEKQSKKIEELKEQNLIQKKQLNDAFDRGWIHKNTIEAEIKEIKNKKGDPLIRGAKIRALQSLLKKGNDANVG